MILRIGAISALLFILPFFSTVNTQGVQHVKQHLGLSSLFTSASWKDIFWREGDPQLCVLVSTYIGHGLGLLTLLSSLLVKEYPYIDIILLDTGESDDGESLEWLKLNRQIMNSRHDNITALSRRNQVHISRRTKTNMRNRHPEADPYGYLHSDLVVVDLREGRVAGVPECDYFAFTNGDNMYNAAFLPAVLPHMRNKVDLIGFEFNTRYPHYSNAVMHPNVPNQQLQTKFEVTFIDKGAAIFRADRTVNHTVFWRFINPKSPKFGHVKPKDYILLDGLFFQDLARMPNVTSVIIPQELLIHQ